MHGTLTVTPAALTITASDKTKAYGAALPTLTASYSGFVNGDTSASLTTQPTLSTTATAAVRAGDPYSITASGAVDPNYTISYVAGSLTVTPVALTITANNQTKAYGAALPTLTASYSGFVNGDTAASLTTQPTLSTTASAASSVSGGPYGITASGAVDANYTISYVAGSLTVTPVALTITASNKSKAYGAALPTLTAGYSGFVNGDTSSSLTTPPTLSTTASSASSVSGGPYSITASGAVDTNYTISYVAGSLTVTPVALTITANNQTKAYGAALPTLTASYSGFVNGDTAASLTTPPTLTTTATLSSIAGNYPITASGAVDANYTIGYVAGTLTVTSNLNAPLVTGISPNLGPLTGGTTVTITGTGFNGATEIDFGSTAVLVSSNPQIQISSDGKTIANVPSPAGTAGTVDVTVKGPGGTSATTTADRFTYNPWIMAGTGDFNGDKKSGRALARSGHRNGRGLDYRRRNADPWPRRSDRLEDRRRWRFQRRRQVRRAVARREDRRRELWRASRYGLPAGRCSGWARPIRRSGS